jgi:hypothetical protein
MQHAVLRRLANDLLALVDKGSGLDGSAIRSVLERIGALLKTHVDMEVEILYPPLLEHGDPDIRELATKMMPRVKDISDGFFTFQDAWSPEKIRANHDAFQRQARFVCDVLEQSTLHEEANLYERIDTVLTKRSESGEGPD